MPGHELGFKPMSASTPRPDMPYTPSWAAVAGAAVAFGLVMGMVSSPVRAEDAATEAPPAAATEAAPAAATTEAAATEATATEDADAPKKKKKKSKKPLPPADVPAPAAAAPAASPAPAAPAAPEVKPTVRTFVNPSDERDDDEITFDEWTYRNPVTFAAMMFSAPVIYLIFFVLGSLNVI